MSIKFIQELTYAASSPLIDYVGGLVDRRRRLISEIL